MVTSVRLHMIQEARLAVRDNVDVAIHHMCAPRMKDGMMNSP